MTILKKCFFILLMTLSMQAFAIPAQIIIFPHAEKEINGPHLSAQGIAQTKILRDFILNSGMYKPNWVIANSTPQKRALGSIETCQPIADALNISVNSQFLRSQVTDMISKVMTDPVYNHQKVLICWDNRDFPTMRDLILKENKSMHATLLQPKGFPPGLLFQ